jgi:hypothetical protein
VDRLAFEQAAWLGNPLSPQTGLVIVGEPAAKPAAKPVAGEPVKQLGERLVDELASRPVRQ